MKIKLLIATDDSDYGGHLSTELSIHHSGVVDATVCTSTERLREVLMTRKFDAALLQASMIEGIDPGSITLPLLLQEADWVADEAPEKLIGIKKYQRISSIVSDVLEHIARVSSARGGDPLRAGITAVWSPAGGVGKTTVALAYAAKMISEGKQALYLNLESFSSVPAYFAQTGKSISTLFEMLENNEGGAQMLIRGIARQDSEGISFFCRPANYDDMNVLSAANISALLGACASMTDELVVDLPCICDERTVRVFDAAEKIFLVTDQASTASTKLSQFTSQHRVFGNIREKVVYVENKGAVTCRTDAEPTIRLPLLRSTDHTMIYKALSVNL